MYVVGTHLKCLNLNSQLMKCIGAHALVNKGIFQGIFQEHACISDAILISADNIFTFFPYFPQKTGSDISCKLPPHRI